MADIYWDDVVLAMPMDGADLSTTFVDLKSKTVTGYGNAKISTTQSKFGGASSQFDGAGDYLIAGDIGDWAFLHNDTSYTIEAWVYWEDASSDPTIVSTAASPSAVGMYFGILESDSRKLIVQMYKGSSGNYLEWKSTTGIAASGWTHVAFVYTTATRTGYFYIDGVQSGPGTPTVVGTWSANSASDPAYNLAIGRYQYTTPGGYFKGYLDDLRLTSGVERYTATFSLPAVSYLSDDPVIVEVVAALEGLYSMVMEQALVGRYGDAGQILAALVGRYGDSALVNAALVGRYGDTLQVLAALDGRYHLMHSVLAGVEGRYAICGAEVFAALEGRYDLRERNEIAAALVGYYSLLPGATLQSITCPVLIGGVAVKWAAVQWTISESSYLIEATISLRDGHEFSAIAKNDQVTITWQGTVYTLFVASKLRNRSVSGSPGALDYGVDYTIVARSLTAGLDEPYALPTTLSWPAATMASAIAAQLIAPLSDILTLDWRLEDWLQPGGTFFLTDETPLAGLRKLAGIVGGILQTSPDNAVIIRKADPVAPRDWAITSPAWTIEDSGLFSDSESEDISSLYNVITVTNQDATDSSIRFETEEIDSSRHRVKGYRVPWLDFTLATSGGSWVAIEDMGIVEEQIVEIVEFIDGASSATHPVYSSVAAVWLRSQLGAITGSEDGSLTTEVTGCSLAEITYTTQYHAWIGRSDRDEEVQFYAVELP